MYPPAGNDACPAGLTPPGTEAPGTVPLGTTPLEMGAPAPEPGAGLLEGSAPAGLPTEAALMGVGPLSIGLPAIGLPGIGLPAPGLATPVLPAIKFGLSGAFAPGGVSTFASVAGEAAGGSRGGLPLAEIVFSSGAEGAG